MRDLKGEKAGSHGRAYKRSKDHLTLPKRGRDAFPFQFLKNELLKGVFNLVSPEPGVQKKKKPPSGKSELKSFF